MGESKHNGIEEITLLPTGIPGLDQILGGGLPAHRLHMIQGLAGSCKTTLACQMAFDQASRGSKVMVLTLIAESHAKLVQHLANFSFFDADMIGDRIEFFGGYHALTLGGLRELLTFITSNLAKSRPDMLIVDGFRSVRDTPPSDLGLSEFMHLLNSLVSTMGCTTVLLSPVQGNLPESENTLVDGLIELSQHEEGLRLVREIKVFKARGAYHLLGKHTFEVTPDGVMVYPRLEAVASRHNPAPGALNSYARFGIAEWDAMTGGGVCAGSVTCLIGHPGVGKTIMGLHFIHEGLREGEPCMVLGFYESPERLLQKARTVGLPMCAHHENEKLRIMWRLPLEVLMDQVAHELLADIDRRGVKRLLIDGIEGFHSISAHKDRIRPFVVALVNELRVRNVTTFITQELPYLKQSVGEADATGSMLYENVMLLKYVEQAGINRRLISVLKMREHSYDPSHHVLQISDRGITINRAISSSASDGPTSGGG
jgi:circadian clock protein KaiC